MSETTGHKSPLETPHVVERNGVSETLKCFIGKRGQWEGKHYQAPQLETDGTDSPPSDDSIFMRGLTFVGKTNLKNFLNVILRRFGQDYVEDAIGAEGTPEAGIFNLERFLTYWKELRSSAMKLSELNEAYQAAVNEYTEFTAGELVAAFDAADVTRINLAKAKMATLKGTLNSLKAEFEERKARRSKEAAAETTAPE
jgi:hypothetical protein